MRRRGFIFTLDALLAFIIAIMFVTSILAIGGQTSNVYVSYQRVEDKVLAEDTLTMLRSTPIIQLVPPDTIKEWESRNLSTIKKWTGDEIPLPVLDTRFVDPYMSPIEIMSTYWALGPKIVEMYKGQGLNETQLQDALHRRAEVILRFILDRVVKGYSYQMIVFANATANPYNYSRPFVAKIGSDYNATSEVAPATLVISGYAYNQTPKGYIARAYLTKLKAKLTSYTYFGSSAFAYAPSSRDYTVIKVVVPNEEENALPYDANITEVKWFPQPRWFRPSSYMRLFIDGEPVKCGQFSDRGFVEYNTWEVLDDKSLADESTCNMLEIIKRHSYLRRHVFEVWVYNPGGVHDDSRYYVGGTHPNSFITLVYTTSQMSTFNYPHVVHFDDIVTSHPFQVENAAFIGGTLRGMSVQVKIKNSSALSIYPKLYLTYLDKRVSVGPGSPLGNETYEWTNTTIMAALNSAGISASDLSDHYIWFAVAFGMDYNDGSWISLGSSEQFSRPVELDYSNSYVVLNYIPHTAKTQYSIDITRQINEDNVVAGRYAENLYGTDFYTMLEWRYHLPRKVNPLWTRLHIVRLFHVSSSGNDQKISISPGGSNWYVLYCHGGGCYPNRPFADPAFTRWGIISGMPDNGGNPIEQAIMPGADNYIKVETGRNYVISKEFTTGDFTYLFDAYAPYGDIFPLLLQGFSKGVRAYNLTYTYGDGETGSVIVGDLAAVMAGNYKNLTACELRPSDYAVDDAIVRLFRKLNGDGCHTPIAISLAETKIEFASVEGVPSTIGPIIITLRVWRDNP